MSSNPRDPQQAADTADAGETDQAPSVPSRRDFIKVGAAGLAATTIAVAGCRTQTPPPVPGGAAGAQVPAAFPANFVGDGTKRRILLRGGVVLSLDPKVGDFEQADVLIDGKLIADIAPESRPPPTPRWSIARARS